MKQLLDQSALDWIESRSLLLATSLNETTKTALRRTLAAGFELGESIPKLTKRIEKYYDVDAKFRAARVARTEVISASAEGTLQRFEAEGINMSEFYPAPDACEECLALVGEYPTREAHAMIPVHSNCRCVFLAVI